jgi:hypothetical protein
VKEIQQRITSIPTNNTLHTGQIMHHPKQIHAKARFFRAVPRPVSLR